MTAHNLPVELTRFVGRAEELADIERLLADRRLVTLAGVGGGGKTRLAVQVASRQLDHWPGGVWLVDLGPVTDPDQVARQAATALGVLIEPGGDPVQALASQLRQRRLLLCLDTCEHLLDAAAALAETVLRGCPEVSVLATSREPLGVPGETVWRTPSLKEDEAVELFADRANLVAPGFDIRAAQTDVRAVCSRVDNIPLAVELAAAWVRALSPAQIAAGLDDRFRLLAGGARRAVPRHQTLQASMAWSHALLDADEQTVFRRMAVFSGNFPLAAVEAVCGGTLAIVGRLVDKSLVTVRETAGRAHYRLLDTVRQYAAERLAEAAETTETRSRHLDFYLASVEKAEPGLDVQRDNVNAALDWGLSTSDGRGRQLAAAMARRWFVDGQVHAGLGFLRRALDPDDRSALQAQLLAGIAMLQTISGRLSTAEATARRALELADENGDEIARGRSLAALTFCHFFTDFELCQDTAREAQRVATEPFFHDWAAIIEGYSLTTRNRHEEATAIARRVYERGDRFCMAFALGIQQWAALETGRLREAAEIGEEQLEIVTAIGDYFAVGTLVSPIALVSGMTGHLAVGRKMMDAVVRSIDEMPDADAVGFEHTMGWLHLWDGDLDNAVRWFGRGIDRMAGNTREWTAARCLPGMTAALRHLGRLDEAWTQAERAAEIATAYGAPYLLAEALDEQALLIAARDPGRARDLCHEALALRRDNGLRTYLLKSLDVLIKLELDAGNEAEAARLLAAAKAARAEIGYPWPPLENPPELDTDTIDPPSLDDILAVVTRGRGPRNRPQVGWSSLTPAELEVVRLIREGLSNPDIAARLYVSRATVKAHLTHIYAKLSVANRTELATVAADRENRLPPA
ncbi:helix-turn-helix transcriptional regulator [Fodinicola acaciae]|uniref:helix-turn-helix transcriptional regulator n=1 Tax=Fodinicola acaciae TaxID=2681555 RepID=UPI0013D69BA5|nr:LuxR C-terminal-related transcriptional regulator [Fodinicola acaciae]